MLPSVAALYDSLLDFESPRHGDDSYPVHKRLQFSDGQHGDIYDWIAERAELRSTDRVLDAGCGVGFGTWRLAARGAAHVTGVTISEREFLRATRAVSTGNALGVDFVYGSFDDLPTGSFDLVVAVESLKHSPDLAVTLSAIRKSLAPGGRLVVVDDMLVGDETSASARRVVSDWSLSRLYPAGDYLRILGSAHCRVVDLTASVRFGAWVVTTTKLAALAAALLLSPARAPALRAFRGGLHLERLYAAAAARYQAIIYSRDGGECW